jgi:hypothetical protein
MKQILACIVYLPAFLAWLIFAPAFALANRVVFYPEWSWLGVEVKFRGKQ